MRENRGGRRALVAAATLLLCAGLAVSCGGDDDDDTGEAATTTAGDTGGAEEGEASGDPIVVGQLTYSTGSLASIGAQVKGGIEMAVDDINAAGGVDGRPIELVAEEAGESPETAVAALQRLLTNDLDALVGAQFTGYVVPEMPIIDSAGLPTLHAAQAPAVVVGDQGSEWGFRIVSDDSVSARVLVPAAIEETGATKVAILHSSTDYGINYRDGIEGVLAEQYPDVEIVTDEQHDDGDTDFTPQLRAIVDSGAEVVFSGQYPAEVAKIANQRREMDITIPFFWNNAADTALGFGLIEQSVLADDYVANDIVPRWSDDPAVSAFTEAYTERFDGDPASVGAGWYSGVLMLADAMARSGDPDDHDALRQALADTDGFTQFGDLTTMGYRYSCDDDNNCSQTSRLYQLQADSQTLVETYDGSAG